MTGAWPKLNGHATPPTWAGTLLGKACLRSQANAPVHNLLAS